MPFALISLCLAGLAAADPTSTSPPFPRSNPPSTRPAAVTVQTLSKSLAPLDRAADRLADALARSAALSPADQTPELTAAARDAAALLGPDFTAAQTLTAAARPAGDTAPDPDALRQTLARVEADLRFRPILEAPVPPGWPAYTPVGEIEIKHYPPYRAASVTGSPIFFRESRNFFTLFRHIQSRDIPMTAPVEIPLRPTDAGELTETGMAFLYPDSATGKTGPADNNAVVVSDLPPVSVVSIALRGKNNDATLKPAFQRLQAWLADHSAEWRPVPGAAPRVLGWNSPSIPAAKAYTELQIPVERVTPPSSPSSPSLPSTSPSAR